MQLDEARAAARGRFMDEQRIRLALKEIQEAPDRRRALRRHIIGECVSALLFILMFATHIFHW